MEFESVAEHILTPYCQALYFAAVNPRLCPEGAFDGHCILVRREAYEFIGGHASNSTFLVDDLKLALLAQRHRMKLGLARTSRLAHARFHHGWSGMWEGLARNGFKLSLLPVSIWLVTLMVQVGRFGLIEANKRRLMCLSMFWHFLDVVWIGVFTFVYLMGSM